MDDDVSIVFEDIVPNANSIAGVKAIFGEIRSRALCFAGRKRLEGKPSYFGLARSLAENASDRRFVLAIGGGSTVKPEYRGRVMAVVQITGTYGPTSAFVEDGDELKRLERWPVAIAARDVFNLVDRPHLVDDLGLPDRRILENSFDGVLHDEDALNELWKRLKGRNVELSRLPIVPHLVDDGRVRFVTKKCELPPVSASEGKKAFWSGYRRERSKLGERVKEENRIANGGRYVCMACKWSDTEGRMLDAHHLIPLQRGERVNTSAHFAVLCPTCHRIAHSKGKAPYDPLSVSEIQEWLKANPRS